MDAEPDPRFELLGLGCHWTHSLFELMGSKFNICIYLVDFLTNMPNIKFGIRARRWEEFDFSHLKVPRQDLWHCFGLIFSSNITCFHLRSWFNHRNSWVLLKLWFLRIELVCVFCWNFIPCQKLIEIYILERVKMTIPYKVR